LDYLKGFGIEAIPRPSPKIAPLAPTALNIQAYENQRPSEAEACRRGDERFLIGLPF
jgi:hypothetical protein